jgi:pimeloyl-ACP methyl ester carboxylesterase
MLTFADWKSQGERIPVRLGGNEFRISSHRRGTGPSLTLLHGFPTSSHDWAATIAQLPDFDTLTFDFLGFGDSDKPADHDYSIHEQTDLVEAMWSHHGVHATFLAVHDYAVSVTQELLARRAEGRLTVDVRGAVFLNGGIYPDLHRAPPGALALLDPERGPRISQMVTEETYTASLVPTFSPTRLPSPAALHELWCGVANRDGHRIGHRLINYIRDRQRHTERWTSALEHTDVPRRFVWGMLDPVSGGHVVPRIRERLPTCPLRCLDTVGHWPAIEDSVTVVNEIRAVVAARR